MKGSSTLSFVLILPWLILLFLSIIWLAVFILRANTLHYAAYGEARSAGLYKTAFRTKTPILFALEKESLDLSHQSEWDRWGYPQMDNWIPYCGANGNYHLCTP